MSDTNKAEQLALAFVGLDTKEKQNLLSNLERVGENKIETYIAKKKGNTSNIYIRHSDISVNLIETKEDGIEIQVIPIDELMVAKGDPLSELEKLQRVSFFVI